MTFGQEYAQAVELKQVAQQEAERARFLVERAEQEKVATVIRAEGDSKAALLISEALQNYGTGLIELRKIEVSVFITPIIGFWSSWSRRLTVFFFFFFFFFLATLTFLFSLLQAAKEIAQTMSRARNVAYLPGGANMLLNLQA